MMCVVVIAMMMSNPVFLIKLVMPFCGIRWASCLFWS